MSTEDVRQLVLLRVEQARTALADAQFLLEGHRSPQSVINRSYYAMFYAALALLQSISKAPSKHTGVISLFDTDFVLKGLLPRELSKDFHKAFEYRQKADYKVTAPVSVALAEETWRKAVRFVDAVSDYLPGDNDETV